MALHKVDISMLEDIPAPGAAGKVLSSDGTNWVNADAAADLPAVGADGNVLTSDGTNWASEEAAAVDGDSIFPFYKADGNSDNITITSGQFPFYKADGVLDNINTPGGGDGLNVGIPLNSVGGDILYHDGSAYARLPKGTAAQTLAMNSGATAPEWADAASGGATPVLDVYNSANLSCLNGNNTTVAFNTETLDSQNAWNSSTYRYTPSAGSYLFIVSIRWATWGANCAQFIYVYKNGYYSAQSSSNQHSSGTAGMNLVSVENANGTDYFEIRVSQQTGGTIDLQADVNSTYLNVLKVS